MKIDKVIIGAGLYGLYAADYLSQITDSGILVLECEPDAFSRATYVNQARVHMGYHYPRSLSTALKSAHYFNRFIKDYSFCLKTKFSQVYATSSDFSWTNAKQFKYFCKNAGIYCEEVSAEKYFKSSMCDGAFLTEEYTYDATILKEYFKQRLSDSLSVTIQYNIYISTIEQTGGYFVITTEDGTKYETNFILNATYASSNQIISKLGYQPFPIKYELCEIIICNSNDALRNIGVTVMDGPFFSIMPFGKTGYHSLTSVAFTPHLTCYEELPSFCCQCAANKKTINTHLLSSASNVFCNPGFLNNCNNCLYKPRTSWPYMSRLARKYLKEEYGFDYSHSLFSMKPILMTSELDDSRPTVIRQSSDKPTFISVLSGKINTVYDLDEVLSNAVK